MSLNYVVVNFSFAPYRVYGIGDSWTAAFGYYGDGNMMPFTDLLFCKPGEGVLNDRCSSNGEWHGLGEAGNELKFAKDYGYGNNISWAAQVAHRVIDKTGGEYKNLAVSGATPNDFRTNGSLNHLTKQVVAADPDLVLITAGGNPILSDVLSRLKECEGDRKKSGGLRECAEKLVNSKYQVFDALTSLYRSLLEAPHTRIVVMSYMTAIVPYFPLNDYRFSEWEVMGGVLNEAITRAVNKVKGERSGKGRLFLAPPVRVPLGNESSSGSVQCRRGSHTFRTNGPSVLADIVQSDFSLSSQANSFCGLGAEYLDNGTWKPAGTAPWFNGQDLGTHLTRLGNQQLADAATRLIESERLLPQS
jgi:lysophospholipase L1-like esterase